MQGVFGFTEHQKIAAYGLGYKSTLQKNIDNQSLTHPAKSYDAAKRVFSQRAFVYYFNWYVPHYNPNESQHNLLEHVLYQAATELTYIKSSSYTKVVTIEKSWTFELDVRGGIDVRVHVVVGRMQRNQFIQQDQTNDTF